MGPTRIMNLAGHKFGLYTAIKMHHERSKYGAVRWECLCACGNTKIVRANHLREGIVSNCGCVSRDKTLAKKKHRLTAPRECNMCHKSKAPSEFGSWRGLKCSHCLHLRRAYGITSQYYEELLEKQDELCGICNRALLPSRNNRHIDHCHDKGFVRGILCPSCNHFVGMAENDQFILHSAIKYLQKTSIGYRRDRGESRA